MHSAKSPSLQQQSSPSSSSPPSSPSFHPSSPSVKSSPSSPQLKSLSPISRADHRRHSSVFNPRTPNYALQPPAARRWTLIRHVTCPNTAISQLCIPNRHSATFLRAYRLQTACDNVCFNRQFVFQNSQLLGYFSLATCLACVAFQT